VAVNDSLDDLYRLIKDGPGAERVEEGVRREDGGDPSVCEIEFTRGHVYGEFIAVRDGLWVIARSKRFRCPRGEDAPSLTSGPARALEELCDRLEFSGWELQEAGANQSWYAHRFNAVTRDAFWDSVEPDPSVAPLVAVAQPEPELLPEPELSPEPELLPEPELSPEPELALEPESQPEPDPVPELLPVAVVRQPEPEPVALTVDDPWYVKPAQARAEPRPVDTDVCVRVFAYTQA